MVWSSDGRFLVQRFSAAVFTLFLGCAAFSSATAAAENLPYLFEQMKKPAYADPLKAIVDGNRGLPAWVNHFVRTQEGVASPGVAVTIDGHAFERYDVCQPHNCGGNFLYVLYPAGGGQAWALITADEKVAAILGSPNEAQKGVLIEASQK